MSEPMMRPNANAEEEAFWDYMRRIRGSARRPADFSAPEDITAFWDQFFEDVNAIEDEPLDGMLMRIPFRREAAQ
ncbi:MAG: hypothetical protein LBB75_09215 [Oscillospiraceae bacterium]|jgi:hypothetical protein|nr:hypothetical protein [Oscillospiraceae bacterium]